MTTYIILPEMVVNGVQRRRNGPKYVSVSDLTAYLYKASSEPGQDATAAQAFRMLAERIQEDSFA